MKILVRLGDLFNASKLIPISSAHVSGVSYKTLGDAPTEFLEVLANADVKAKVRATLNPHGFDEEYLGKRLDEDFRCKQLKVLGLFEKMGFVQSLTCTPYYLKKPAKNAHIAWAESSAVVYSNSVLGAWTNREGGPSALAAAVIGKTPDCGMHRAENRQSQVLVTLEGQLRNETEFGALGICLGKILGDMIPMIKGIRNASKDNLKQLGAALASSGMVNMFCFKNASTEAEKLEKITIGNEELKQTTENLSTNPKAKSDLVFIGCPHCSLNEIKQIANLIDGKKVKNGTECWVCTSRYVKEKAKNYVRKIERSGAHIITDTCAVVTWTDRLGIRTIMTNSAKTAHYAPTLNKAETIFATLKECLKTAVKG
jgi:predicted aconitase